MTQKEKDLLLKDLCARLPYGVKVGVINEDNEHRIVKIGEGNIGHLGKGFWKDCKPYLFPLSSMTEEQVYNNPIGFSQMLTIKADRDWENITINRRAYYKLVDWFNKNHFDYRGLIEEGLAIDATGLNIY